MIVGNEKATDAVASIIEHKQTNGVPGDHGGRMRGSEAVIITGGMIIFLSEKLYLK